MDMVHSLLSLRLVIYPAEMLLTFFQLQEIKYAKPSVKPDYTIVLIVM